MDQNKLVQEELIWVDPETDFTFISCSYQDRGIQPTQPDFKKHQRKRKNPKSLKLLRLPQCDLEQGYRNKLFSLYRCRSFGVWEHRKTCPNPVKNAITIETQAVPTLQRSDLLIWCLVIFLIWW